MRMNRVLEVDYDNQIAVVEPGLVNLHLSWAVGPRGYYYAPDPSSQQACTIGGNIANNSGGPHTLKYGVTTNHVLGLEVVMPDGEIVWLGRQDARRARLRPRRRLRGLRGHVRDRHEDRRPHPQEAAGGQDRARASSTRSTSASDGGLGDHRARARARGHGDDRPADDPGRRGRVRLRLPARRRRGAPDRARRARRSAWRRRPSASSQACRDAGRARDPHGARRGRAPAPLEGTQVRLRRLRPDLTRLHGDGRRHPAHEAPVRAPTA